MRVLVTGAAGCIGRVVCEQLIRDGQQVRGLARNEIPHGDWWRGVEWSVGDLLEMDLDTLAAGVDAVVHLAALVHRSTPRDESAYLRMNARVTQELLDAAIGHGIDPRRIVFSSSVGVCQPRAEGIGDEDSPLLPRDPYSRSKLEAERHVRRAGGVILRFPLVYGAGDRGNVARMVRAICGGWFVLPRDQIGRRSMLGARNAAAAISLALQAPLAHLGSSTRTWLVTDAQPIAVDRLARAIAAAADVGMPRRIPDIMLTAAALVGDAAASAGLPAPLTRSTLAKIRCDLEFSSARIRDDLGHRDVVTLERGIADQLRLM